MYNKKKKKLFTLNKQWSEDNILNPTCSFLAVSLLEIIPLSSFCFLWSLIRSIILFSKLLFIVTCKKTSSWYKAEHYTFLWYINVLPVNGNKNAEIVLPFKSLLFQFYLSLAKLSYERYRLFKLYAAVFFSLTWNRKNHSLLQRRPVYILKNTGIPLT